MRMKISFSTLLCGSRSSFKKFKHRLHRPARAASPEYLKVSHSANLDNVFIPKTMEKQCAKNEAIYKDIDEWIYGSKSME